MKKSLFFAFFSFLAISLAPISTYATESQRNLDIYLPPNPTSEDKKAESILPGEIPLPEDATSPSKVLPLLLALFNQLH